MGGERRRVGAPVSLSTTSIIATVLCPGRQHTSSAWAPSADSTLSASVDFSYDDKATRRPSRVCSSATIKAPAYERHRPLQLLPTPSAHVLDRPSPSVAPNRPLVGDLRLRRLPTASVRARAYAALLFRGRCCWTAIVCGCWCRRTRLWVLVLILETPRPQCFVTDRRPTAASSRHPRRRP